MPTYNRAPDYLHLIEESVESFLRQNYPNKELVILNDTPGQELICDSPGVRVVNLNARLASLGGKRNLLARLAKGELLCPWDDDDISLPWRLSQGVERLGILDYFNPRREWYLPSSGLVSNHNHGVCHNASMFTKLALKKVGGYPKDASGDEDALIDILLNTLTYTATPLSDDPSEWSYIYRWGVSPVHISGTLPHKDFYQQIGERPVTPGRFVITPNWKIDYEELCRKHVATNYPDAAGGSGNKPTRLASQSAS